jgi:chaperonin GroEL
MTTTEAIIVDAPAKPDAAAAPRPPMGGMGGMGGMGMGGMPAF